ncbi:class I SAM-dependent methyltransferase [Mesorhizobium escarrei]|uniref:Methyltransf_11 domain-containing protein n=1 Tax=Mesorhizobium escarrei TaxID=666018 RepID=A0ABN8KAR4_9HYPH|nr:class I SAM-dependent methyltransferase [Mesorhizobium escarrei]CAH2406504.1 Methyltransf_11 domain-containing protein [Mesorhizobium escarrei]
MHLARFLADQTKATLKNPARIGMVFSPTGARRLRAMVVNSFQLRNISSDWQQDGNLKSRRYNSYDQYVKHQRAKVETLDLGSYDERYYAALADRLRGIEPGIIPKTGSVLCLGARLGTEVRAFIGQGYFALGIDLNPGVDNKYVVTGDFHHLQFADSSVDLAFTNALDHVFDIDKVLAEVSRVLKPGGTFIVEAVRGTDEGKEPESFASFWWKSVDDLVEFFNKKGFEATSRSRFAFPWGGHFLCLRLSK